MPAVVVLAEDDFAIANQQRLTCEVGGSTRSQTWAALRELLSSVAGLPVAAITREMRLPEEIW